MLTKQIWERASRVHESSELVLQVGVGGLFALKVLQMVFDFLKNQRARQAANGEDQSSAGQCMLNGAYFKELIRAIDDNTRGMRDLLEHEEEEKRILNRVEKQLDQINQYPGGKHGNRL